MSVPKQVYDSRLKPCPFCNQSILFTDIVQYEKGEDEGFKVGCGCGWAARSIRRWYANKNQLIEKWNSLIDDGEIIEDKS